MTFRLSKSRIQRLRREARRRARQRDISHLTVLHELAAEHGFADWSQLLRVSNATLATRPESAVAAHTEPADTSPRVVSSYKAVVAQLGLRNPPPLREVLEVMDGKAWKRGRAADQAPAEATFGTKAARNIASLMLMRLTPASAYSVAAILNPARMARKS